MLEIEMKFSVADFTPIRAKLVAWQARPEEAVLEADHYHNAPDRDFARTDEALRLRREGDKNKITYKGPKHAGVAKTRTEIEVALEPGEEAAEKFCRLLVQLGYRPVAIVRKKRICYSFERDGFDLQACLDDVSGVGQFVEVEIVAAEEKKAKAEAVLARVAEELGLRGPERRSYLEMVLGVTNKVQAE